MTPVSRPGSELASAAAATRLPEPTLRLRHWGETVALIVGAGLVAIGFTNLSSTALTSSVLLGAAAAIAAVLVAVRGHRTNRRCRTVHSAAQVISQLLKSQVVIDRVRWKGPRVGQIVALRLGYTDLAAAAYGNQLSTLLAQAVEQTLRRPFVVTRHQPDRHRAVLTVAPTEPADEDLTELQRQQQRVRDVVGETFGSDATLDHFDHRDDSVTRFAVHYRSTALKLTVPAVRRRVTNAVAERLAGSWRANFALEGDSVTFTRRPPLPTFVPRKATAPPEPGNPDYNLMPQAVDEDGTIVSWDIAGVMAHLLRAGRTRTGKTITLIGDAMEAARRGFRVFVLDPKRVEFLGLRTWPNVQLVATTVAEQVALVHMLKLEMDERYRKVEEEGFPESDFEPILFIIDEYRQLYGNVSAWWRSIKVAGMPAECPIFDEIGSLLRMAGYCRIHVDLATQRPDAAFLAGEALALDTPVPTPTGWTTMGDLQVGDRVFDEQGRPVSVTAVTGVYRNRPCFRVTFSDGTALIADENHLWAVFDGAQRVSDAVVRKNLSRDQLYPHHRMLADRLAALLTNDHDVTVSELESEVGAGRIDLLRRRLNDGRWKLSPSGTRLGLNGRFSGRTYRRFELLQALHAELTSAAPTWRRTGPQTVTTRHLADTLARATVTRERSPGWSIPVTEPLQLDDAELPIDPWLLGYWLGDGHKAAATIATNDAEVLERIRSLGYRVTYYARYNYGISTGPRGGWNRPSLQRSLRELDLLHNKHVPAIYLRASARQRSELLAGLLDADGSSAVRDRGTPSGQVVFSNTNRRLIDAVYELASSLGFVPTIRQVRRAGYERCESSVAFGRPTRDAWVVKFTPGRQVFGIGRKQAHLAAAFPDGERPPKQRYIIAVEPVHPVPVRCIAVDSPTHLYLVGRSFIATHNCRDNFSARAATGRLSPDGAEMMFDNPHVGVSVPLNVRGRGTIVGVDEQPKEVQFFYTPDPRRPRNDDDRHLLAALRPPTTTWPRLSVQLPDLDEVAGNLPDGKKTCLEWEQLQQATFVAAGEDPDPLVEDAARDTNADPEANRDDDGQEWPSDRGEADGSFDGFQEPQLIRAGGIEVGDFVLLEERGWVCVSDVARFLGDTDTQLEWRSDAGGTGDLLISRFELLEVRRPLP